MSLLPSRACYVTFSFITFDQLGQAIFWDSNITEGFLQVDFYFILRQEKTPKETFFGPVTQSHFLSLRREGVRDKKRRNFKASPTTESSKIA